MANLRHSKYKNTGLLFEFLTRQVTSDVINDVDSSALKIMESFFGKNTELAKELELYRMLVNEKFNSEKQASDLLEKVITHRQNLSNTLLKKQKYDLIKEIKKHYNIDTFFGTNVNNYKEYASIYKLFEYNEGDNIPDYMRCKNTLVEHIQKNSSNVSPQADILKDEDFDTRILVYEIMVDKFNEKYDELLPEQKNILKMYIDNCDNKKKLKQQLISEIDNVSSKLVEVKEKTNQDVIKIKINEIDKIVQNLKTINEVGDNHIIGLMKSYQLVNEMERINNG